MKKRNDLSISFSKVRLSIIIFSTYGSTSKQGYRCHPYILWVGQVAHHYEKRLILYPMILTIIFYSAVSEKLLSKLTDVIKTAYFVILKLLY